MVMSLAIRSLAALNAPPPPHTKNVLYRAALCGRRRRYAHAYGFYAPFYCISLKKIYGQPFQPIRVQET